MSNFKLRKNPETGQVFMWEDGQADWREVQARKDVKSGEVFVYGDGDRDWRNIGKYEGVQVRPQARPDGLAPEVQEPQVNLGDLVRPKARPDRAVAGPQPEAPQPNPHPPSYVAPTAPAQVLSQVMMGLSDDAKAATGFGRSPYLRGLVDTPSVQLDADPVGSVQEQLARAMGAPQSAPDPFAGETFGELAKRRGQEVAQGTMGVLSSVARARGIDDRTLADAIQRDAPDNVREAARQLSRFEDILRAGMSDDGRTPMSEQERALYTQRRDEAAEAVRQWSDVQEFGPAFVGNRTAGAEEAAGKLKDWTDKTFGVPPRDDSLWSDLSYGAGSMVGFVLPSVLAGPAGSLVTAQMGADAAKVEAYDRAKQFGASERDAQISASIMGFLGTAEALPIAAALNRLPASVRSDVIGRLGRFVSSTVKGSIEEGVQEAGLAVAQNLTERGVYNPERQIIDKDVGTQALVGMILGGFLGGGANAVGLQKQPTAGPASQEQREPEETPPVRRAEPVREGATPTQSPTDSILDAMGAQPERQEAPQNTPAPDREAQTEDAGNVVIMDETETVDGENRPTGRKVRVNLDTGEVSPVEGVPLPPEADAVPAQPSDNSVLGSEPGAGSVEQPDSTIRTETLTTEQVADVGTDAKTFQYKDGGDEQGVTDRLQGVTDWDERSAMGGIVYEYADGRRVAADGHQRLGLAKRLQSEGKQTPWTVEVIREVDGYTPADVRRIAALKNIREGSGTAIDAAKVLREAPGEVDSLSLPPKSAIVRDAKGLAKLSDEAFGAVVNGVVPESYGAVVGQSVRDPALHADVIALLARLKPTNARQAEMIAQQAGQASTTETQTTLFGEEDVAESLYLERAKVLDNALSRLRQDRQTFKVLADRADTITAEGNRLNSDANTKRLESDAEMQAYLQAEANRKGPISDALTAAARDLKANPRQVGRIAGEFLDAIRKDDGRVRPDRATPDRERTEGQGKPDAEEVKPEPTPRDNLLASMGAPTTEKTEAGEQAVIPGAEQDKVRSDDARKADQRRELDARQRQSKMRSGAGQQEAGPLFDTQGDLLDRAEKKPDADFSDALGDVFGEQKDGAKPGQFVDHTPSWAQGDQVFTDLSDGFDGFDPANLAADARDWILRKGRRPAKEHLVLFNADGEVIAIGSGHKNGTGVSPAMSLAFDPDQSLMAHHNHPQDVALSEGDMVFAFLPGVKAIYAHGHDGTTYRGEATPLFRSTMRIPSALSGENAFIHGVRRQSEIKKRITEADHYLFKNAINRLTELRDAGAFPDARQNKKSWSSLIMGKHHKAAFNLAMEEAGLLDLYTDGPGAVFMDRSQNLFLTDERLRTLYDTVVARLKRLAETEGKEGTDVRSADNGRHPAELEGVFDDAPKQPAAEKQPDPGDVRDGNQGRSERDRDEGEGGDLTADPDFAGALGDVFGQRRAEAAEPKPKPKRPKADIAKDMSAILRGLKQSDRAAVADDKYEKLSPLFIEALDGIDVATNDRRSVFVAMIRPLADAGMSREDVAALEPYFTRFLDDVESGKIDLEGDADAPGTGSDLEPDSGDAGSGDDLGGTDVSASGRSDGNGSGRRGTATDGRDGQREGGGSVPDGGASGVGAGRNQGVQRGERRADREPADDQDGAGGRDGGEQRLPADDGTAADTAQNAANRPGVGDRQAQQAKADKHRVIPADEASVRRSLPLLLPEQQDDVIKVEQRFAKPDGHGMLLTNGTGTGKAQPLDAGILTPGGWKTMGDIHEGDFVIGVDGRPTRVTGVFPQGIKPIYRVLFSDGTATECCDEHLWETQTLYERRKSRTNPEWNCAKAKVRDLAEIRETLDKQHFVPVVAAVEHEKRKLPVPAYTLGAILGDGCVRQSSVTISSGDAELFRNLSSDIGDGFELRPVGASTPTVRISEVTMERDSGRFTSHAMVADLRGLDVMGKYAHEKRIPSDYLVSSIDDRVAVLHGLMDTDGTVDRRTGSVSFCTTSAGLADDISQLIRSLGGTASTTKSSKSFTHKGVKKAGRLAYIVSMHLPNEVAPFRIARKANLVRPKCHPPRRKIVDIQKVGSKLAQCIRVAHDRSLYVTDGYVVTHNTYSGGGVIKRFTQQGKDNILILAPSQGILDAWVDMGADMGIPITKLEDTQSAGQGVVATTYANAADNMELAKRDWDLVVPDESHKLSSNATGDATGALATVRAITNRPADLSHRARMINHKEWEAAKAMPGGDAKGDSILSTEQFAEAREARSAKFAELRAKDDALVEKFKAKPRSKVLFLSATPFAYDKNVDYAEGYLFNYGADGTTESGSRQDGRAFFFVQNFGYRIRYHKLTKPEGAVDSGVFEREFHERLKREGVLSGRALSQKTDYDRRFVTVDDKNASRIDEVMKHIWDKGDNTPEGREWRELSDHVRRNFTYLRRMQLLEAIKAKAAIPIIRQHLALGRKVVVFHDYNVGGGFNPFTGSDVVTPTVGAMKAYAKLKAELPFVENMNFAGYQAPVDAMKSAFGNDALFYNGTVSNKERDAAKAAFNKDGSGKDLIVVQSAAGEAGISLHDTTGQHQRVLINLGMPTRPTTTLQEEGRIRRVGSETDAAFRYLTIGTSWEREAFASKIATRSGTVENLALGNEARAIKDAFVDAYMEADAYPPGEGDGKGGKDRDRSVAKVSPFDQAKTHYFGRMKDNRKRSQRSGIDHYATPEPLGFKMVEWAGIRANEKVLEPSAGDGAIARYFPGDSDPTIIEPSIDLLTKAQLRTEGANAKQERFEDHHIVNKYDAIVMNPPFGSGGKVAYEHLQKAMGHIRGRGRIVALVPMGPAADKRWEALDTSEWAVSTMVLPTVTFEKAGTSVAARIIILDKIGPRSRNAEVFAEMDANSSFTDLRHAKDIGEFFDRIEDLRGPARPEQEAEPETAITVDAPTLETGGDEAFDVFDFQNTKTGDDVYGVQVREKLGDRYREVLAVAKSHGGYYSKYQNKAAGAKRGFLFKSDEDRQAFMDDLQKPTVTRDQAATGTPEFKAWFGDSKVVDENGAPLVVYHGAPVHFDAFDPDAEPNNYADDRGKFHFTSSRGTAEAYAEFTGPFGETPSPEPTVIGAYLSIQNPIEHYATHGSTAIEEWDNYAPTILDQNNDGSKDGVIITADDGETLFVAFSPTQIKSVNNRGTFDPSDPRILHRQGAADAIAPHIPSLRAELDRLNLKRVNLGRDQSGRNRQGAFQSNLPGRMEILIGASLDPQATLHHEAIHAMRAMNLFTPTEWRALEIKAARSWVEKHDIEKRYPDLLPSEQIEEAIAEEFAAWAKEGGRAKGGLLSAAFAKMKRFMEAIGNVFRGAGFQTAEDVFGRARSGEVGARDTGAMAALQEAAQAQPARAPQTPQAKAHAATRMMGSPAHIPNRGIWDELARKNSGVWPRLRGGAAAAHDKVDSARIWIQDRFLPVLRAQEVIIRETGQALPEEQNAYLAEETFSGKVGRHLFEIDEDYTKRIIDVMVGEKGEDTLSDEFVGEWLYARHATERNARIASINPRMPDGGSGMMTADAQAILADAQAGPYADRLKKIGDMLDELRERSLKLREDAGLITATEAAIWRKQYQHYVPLKGFADTDHSDAMLDITGVGRKFNTRGPESKRALGRRSLAFNPLQAAITQAQEVAIRAEKNRVGQALYIVAKENPAPAMWEVKTPKQKQFYNRSTGLVETRVEDPVSLILQPNEMAVKVNGKEQRILFNDIRLAESAGTVGADQMNWFLSMMSVFSGFFSVMQTMYDPEFVIRNAVRDMQAAQINIRNFGKEDRNRIAKAMIKNWPKAFVGAYRGQLNKADSEWTKYYREFDQSGAKVAFWKLEQPEAAQDDLRKRVKLAGGNILQRGSRFVRFSTRDNPVLGFVERTNLAVDNAVRLAAYVEARKAGWSKSEAASLSKNLTVNFNRRGKWGASINALYPFANAGIQGTQILFRAMTSKRMAKYALGLFAMGSILDQVNSSLSEEDEDGELAYDKIPDWKNQMNLVVMLGPDADNAATFWLPYGYNLFPYAGQQASKIARGVKKPGDAMRDFASAVFGSFSPLGGRDLQSVLTPTILDPINEMYANKDWLGRPIRPENPWSDYGPKAYKFYAGASDASRAISDIANRATGGTIAESGWLDVSPEYIDHAFGFVTGGAGRFVGRSSDTIGKLVTGRVDEIESRNIPFYRSLQYEAGGWLDQGRYYRFRDEVKAARDAQKTYQENRLPVPGDVRRLASLYDLTKEADKVLRETRKRKNAIIERTDLDFSRRQAAIRRIEERNAKVYLRFNKAFLNRMGPQGE